MFISSVSVSHRTILFCLVIAAAMTIVFVLPSQKQSAASAGLFAGTAGHEASLPNYDIRVDKLAVDKVAAFRISNRRSAAEVADIRETMFQGEIALRQQVPSLVVEYNNDLHIPEVIAPGVRLGKAVLSAPSSVKRPEILKNFLNQNASLLGATVSEIGSLKIAADYTNPDGNLSFVELDQELGGIPVFRGEVKAGFTKSGEMVRVINNFAPGLDPAVISTDFGDPANAVKLAGEYINTDLSRIELTRNEKTSTDLKVVFGGDSAPTAEKMYFPTEPGIAVPAWRVLIWQPVRAYYVIVDAQTSVLLWRKNITEDQTQAATYNVYANPNSLINIAHSPFPFSPGPTSPNGSQGTAILRSRITQVGNEAPYTFNQLGWIPDGRNTTDGNNVQAGLDRELPSSIIGIPDDIDPTGMAVGQPNRIFDFPINPSIPTNPVQNGGDSPLPPGQAATICLAEGTAAPPTDYQKASVTQLFYAVNRYHDEMYLLGFTEAARNFQNVNFTGQGLGGDRVSAQAQDCGGVNNANFGTPADGARPTMQMFLFNGPSPNIDGSLDAEIVIHEHTHGLSNRLHGNSSGLFNDMSRGMGEGWSDFYAMSMLSQPSDPIDGIYTVAAYSTYRYNGGLNNSYYGIRRFPTAIKTSLGGPDNRPHDPLTFADIDSNRINLSDGAFPPRTTGNADEVHNAGEIWCAMLWEIRARMVMRLGWSTGNRRAMQVVMDGMKLAPLSPTYMSERDAIIAGAAASGPPEDVADIWAGFATRGLGANATIENVGGTSIGGSGTTHVTEAFDLPNLYQTPSITVSDAPGDNDGYPEPGETVSVTIPITNSTGVTATNVTIQIVDGGSALYGTLSGISTLSRQVSFTIPPGAACGSIIPLTINVISSLGPVSFTRQVFVGRPAATVAAENFDGVTAPALPAGWTATEVSGGINFVTSTTTPDTAPNTLFALDPISIGGGTDLTAPPISVTSSASTVTFRNMYNTESKWDGGVLEISVAGAAFQDILAAGGSFLQNGYNGALGAGNNNPIANRAAWTGNSAGYLTTIAQLPSNANGKVVQLRWRFGADDNTAGTGPNPGWSVDSIALSGAGFVTEFACSPPIPPVSISGRVLTPNGIGLRNASVSISDTFGLVRRFVTNSFGVYIIDGVRPAGTYTISVNSKRYRFQPQVVSVTAALANVDFVGLE